MPEQHQLVSTQGKDWVCHRYLHTHSLKPVLCSAPIHAQDGCGVSWESAALSRCVTISLLIEVAGGFMVVSLQEGWNDSGEPLDTDFLEFQVLQNYVLAFLLHWFFSTQPSSRLACCAHTDQTCCNKFHMPCSSSFTLGRQHGSWPLTLLMH